jgi:two-component system sensor histidine kinase PilS (NtrC family)
MFLRLHRNDTPAWDERSVNRLHLLVVSRMVILFVLLLLSVLMERGIADPLLARSLRFFSLIITVSFFLSLFYFLLIKHIGRLTFHVYLQALFDVCLITALVYVTGGVRSVYPVFYPLVIIYAVVFLGRQGGLVVASLASICYGMLVNLEFYAVIAPFYLQPEAYVPDRSLEYSGFVFFRLLVYILSFYLIALIASFVVGQEQKTRQLLREKEYAFAALDSFHRSIVESVNTGILTIDLEGRIKSFNRAAQEILGRPASEVLEKNLLAIMPEYREVNSEEPELEDAASRRQWVEITIKGQDGVPVVLGCAVSPLKGNDGQMIGRILIFQDITKIKDMERAYEESRKMAFIGEMAAILAHEIRNPLASISGSVQVLKKSEALNSMDERLLQIILRGKDQLESFIKDFLILARSTSGTHEEIDVVAMLEEILEAVKYGPSWQEEITVEAVHPPAVLFTANRTELRQLLWNLILNALQAMPDGGRLHVDLNLAREENDRPWLTVRVADQGLGIAEGDIKKIFEPFFTTKEQGTGLGLAIVNRIVTVYGGTLKVDSTPGEGTVFTVRLPSSLSA